MRILVIDDEKPVRRALQRLLARKYDVYTAESASEGLFLLACEAFDAILCDVNLGGMDGVELLSWLSPADAARLIFMTGDPLADGDFLSGHVLLRKPFTFEALVMALGSWTSNAAE